MDFRKYEWFQWCETVSEVIHLLVATSKEHDYLLLVNLETSEVTKTEFKNVFSLIGSIPDCVVTTRRFI